MMPNINPKQMDKMMKKLGMKQEDIPASEVIIKSSGKDIIIRNPHVTKINMMGQVSFQVTGDISEGLGISREDVLTVAHQANVSEKDALRSLEKHHGDLAESILALKK